LKTFLKKSNVSEINFRTFLIFFLKNWIFSKKTNLFFGWGWHEIYKMDERGNFMNRGMTLASVRLYMYVYVCMYVCMYACMHACMYVCICVCICICICLCICKCMCICKCKYMLMYVYVNVCICICISICTYMYM